MTQPQQTINFAPVTQDILSSIRDMRSAVPRLSLGDARDVVKHGHFTGTASEVAAIIKALSPYTKVQSPDKTVAMHRLAHEAQRISDRVIVFVVNKLADLLEKI